MVRGGQVWPLDGVRILSFFFSLAYLILRTSVHTRCLLVSSFAIADLLMEQADEMLSEDEDARDMIDLFGAGFGGLEDFDELGEGGASYDPADDAASMIQDLEAQIDPPLATEDLSAPSVDMLDEASSGHDEL